MISMLDSLILGSVQGVTEWLPVSSEGVTAAAYSWLLKRPLSDAVAFALWLHMGTAFSALVALRPEVGEILRDVRFPPRRPSVVTSFLATTTTASALVGFPLLLALQEFSSVVGGAAMGLVGVLMLGTSALQWRRPSAGVRDRHSLTLRDAVVVGVVQGVAVLPGFSRSGATIAVLLC